MFTHMINEDAYDYLLRAKSASLLLSSLLTTYQESNPDGIPTAQVAILLDYVYQDIAKGLAGCEEIVIRATVQKLTITATD